MAESGHAREGAEARQYWHVVTKLTAVRRMRIGNRYIVSDSDTPRWRTLGTDSGDALSTVRELSSLAFTWAFLYLPAKNRNPRCSRQVGRKGMQDCLASPARGLRDRGFQTTEGRPRAFPLASQSTELTGRPAEWLAAQRATFLWLTDWRVE